MNQEDWQKAKQIFNDALKLPAGERAKYLDKVCSDGPMLGEQVKTLLESYESGFLEETAVHKVAEIISGSSLKVGQQIGRYEIKEILGTGGMGEVFLAEDSELRRPVAIKVLHPEVAEDKERVSRFIQEARAASALNHPNILTIHEIGKFEDSRFIVSEYVKGETLRGRLKRENLDLPKSLDIAAQVAAALEAAHEAGIIHRDIKPENIIVRADGLVKVLDFGLAKLSEPPALAGGLNSDSEASTLAEVRTNPGVVMGTIAYMSPEQARGVAVDARTDIWSLGVVLYEMLSGKMPFPGETTSDIIASILKTEAEPFKNLDKKIPRELEEICFKALAKKPIERYQTAREFLQDLKGAKKRMESVMEQTTVKQFNYTDERNTELIRHRPTISAEYIITGVKRHKLATFSSLILIAFLAIAIGVYQFNGAPQNKSEGLTMPLVIDENTTEKDLKFSKLAVSSKISDIAISPDGKYVAYVTGEVGKMSIHLLQRDTSADLEIVPPNATQGKSNFRHLSFTPDGNYLYYNYLTEEKNFIYKVPVLGGTPTKIVEDTTNGGSVSPDGKTIAFNRWYESDGGGIYLMLANADGSNERTLVKSSINDMIICGGAAAWSPDGKTIACWVHFTEGKEKYFKLFSINAADGSRQELSIQKWDQISGAVWMPDGNLIVTGKEKSAEYLTPQQIWLIAPNTAPKRITNDLDGFSKVSATAKGDVLVTLQPKQMRDLWILPNNDASRARQVTFTGEVGGGARWMPDGKLVFASKITGNNQIWTMNADGTNRKQLTSTQGGNIAAIAAIASPDGRYIFFQSARVDSTLHIFRMDADGSNVKQLTDGARQRWAQISPDGKWVYYNQNPQNEIRKIPSEGGEPVVLATAPKGTVFDSIDVSRVNGLLAYRLIATEQNLLHLNHKIFIISPDGAPVKTLDLPPTSQQNPPQVSTKFFHWTPDGRSIAFNDSRNNWANIWSIPVDGRKKEKPLTNFTTELTQNFDWSPDGKQLLVIRDIETSNGVIITRAQ